MNITDEILKRYSWPTITLSSNSMIADIERAIGFELADDYKDFISRYSSHETVIGKEYVRLWNKEELLSLNQTYEIPVNLPLTVGIGDNGAGELIAVEQLNTGHQRVILTPFTDLDKHYHIEIGKSFTDFLLRLDNGEKWFKGNERTS